MNAPASPSVAAAASPRRLAVAGFLGLLLPGLGHLLVGRRRPAVLFLTPTILLIAGILGMYAGGGLTAILAFVVTPGVLPALAILNILVAAWRIGAAVDAARPTSNPGLAAALLVPAILLLVVAPQAWINTTISAASDFLDTTFAVSPDETREPDEPDITLPPDWTFDPQTGEETPWPSAEESLGPSQTPKPPRTPGPPRTAGTGSLPGLNISVPWDRPGAVPWGDDGRFDLLLLGSDAGPDRWSRRMDVMLLVEIDVATGKTAMVGLPRNLVNAPFPPGPARDAVSCGCFRDLLNALYVEATFRHPERWPGTGTVQGIGAVRAVVSELTGRPVDAVLVADLWGVIKVVDAMGGIDINVPSAVYDSHYPDPVVGPMALYIPAGKQHFDGRTALAYARSRHASSDYTRMARQQTLLIAIREDIGPDTILNAPALFSAAKGFAWTDLPRDSLPNLVQLFGKAADASVKHLRIVPPSYSTWLTPSEITRIRKDIAKLRGVPVPPTPSPSLDSSAAPSPSDGSSAEHSTQPGETPAPTPTPSPPPPTPAPSAGPT
ncbi:MAG TPA: LCP family protein [Candidatus Binatia bacterium]|nr:LCP family protein [Candidatus Binatia bacterium]